MNAVKNVIGNPVQGDIETKLLFEEAKKKFDIYHIAIDDSATSYHWHKKKIHESFGGLLGDNFKVSTCNNLAKTVSDIIKNSDNTCITNTNTSTESTYKYSENGVSW